MLLNGLYYGLMLVMALYNAFVYFSIRERSYLVYVCFVLSAAIAQLAMSGFELSVPLANVAVVGWGECCLRTCALGTIFLPDFLRWSFYNSKVRSLARAITQMVVGLSTILAIGSFFIPYGYAARAQVVLIVCAIPLCITAGVISWRAGSVEAKFYSIAWFSFLGGAMLLALTYVGVLPANAITTRGHEVGGALLVVFSPSLWLRNKSSRRVRALSHRAFWEIGRACIGTRRARGLRTSSRVRSLRTSPMSYGPRSMP